MKLLIIIILALNPQPLSRLDFHNPAFNVLDTSTYYGGVGK